MSKRRWLLIACAVLVLGVLALVYFTCDPSKASFFPKCIVYRLTGFKCAGCGSQRAIHALLHADLATAWRYNAAMVVSIPVVLLYFWSDFWRDKSGRLYAALNSSTAAITVFVLVVAWTVLRNVFGW